MKLHLHHIGIAASDIEQMKKYLEHNFEIESFSETVYDVNQKASLVMAVTTDGQRIELIAGEPVEKLVKKQQFLYHTCYETEDIEESIKDLLNQDSYLVREPREAVLFENRKVAFLATQIGLIELLERKA